MPLDARDAAHLLDMLKLASDLMADTSGVTQQQFLDDRRLQLLIDRELELLGVCAMRVSRQFQSEHPEIPWRSIIGLRHVLAHQYEEVDHERVWSTVWEYVPKLVSALRPLIPPAPPDPEPEP